MPSEQETKQLLTIIDQAYDRKSWHGTNLRGSIRRVSAEVAAWRPGKKRHNIWEIVVHAAYWKYVVRRRITGEPRGSFPLKGSNWFHRPEKLTEKAWKADVALLDEIHHSMRDAISDLSSPAGHFPFISGVAAHDLYHAGQIQLLKRVATD
jgi:hypothetical protein